MDESLVVSSDGFVRFYRSNGSGLVEYAMVKADLAVEDIARLSFSLNAFLAEADRGHGAPASAITIRPRELADRPRVERPNLSKSIHTFLVEHPGSLSSAIVDALGMPRGKPVWNALTAGRRLGIFRKDEEQRWYAVGAYHTRGTRKVGGRIPPTSRDHAAADERIVAYVREHPGEMRTAVRAAVEMDPVYFGNRISRMAIQGRIIQTPDAADNRRTRLTVGKEPDGEQTAAIEAG